MNISIVSGIIESLGYQDIVEGCYDLGIYALELNIDGDLLSSKSEEKREALFRRLRSNRIKVEAVTWGDMLPDEKTVNVAQFIFKSPHLDRRMIKLMPPHHTVPEVSDTEYAEQISEKLNLILAKTESMDVELTMENHGSYDRPLGVRKEFLQNILKLVDNERFGICLDTGCFYWYYPLDEYYEVTEVFLPYVNHVHLKNQSFPPGQKYDYKIGVPVQAAHDNLYEGDVDLARVIDMLKGVGYEGDLCIEDHSTGLMKKKGASMSALRQVIKNDIEFLRSTI